MERVINHFSDPRPLLLQNIEERILVCKVCTLPISGWHYFCFSCSFYIHSSCAKLPREMEHHPFHPQHTLTLLAQSSYESANFLFHCSEREIFEMDLDCAAMMPIKGCMRSPQILKNSSHPHHPFISTLNKHDRIVQCGACGSYNRGGFFYRCEQCDFDLEIFCASLTPTTTNEKKDDGNVSTTHPHPLIECYQKTKYLQPLACSGCMGLFQEEAESIYVCLHSPKLLHKSCAHSPRQIDHPFHLANPLNLYDEMPAYGQMQSVNHKCKACMIIYSKETCHFYRCRECDFNLHTKCALPIAPFINSQAVLHQHPLAFFDIQKALPCYACKLLCYYPFFRCVECDFNLHVHCLSGLPPTVKHKCHRHPLTLTHSPVKDHEDEDDDAEFYCDACEKYRLLKEPTYYCVECHYVAHVHCVISEVFPYLEREFESLGDKLDKMKLDITLDVVEDIAGPELQRDAKEEKVEELEGAFIGAEIENDVFAARADDSSAEVVKELVVMDTAGEALLAELDAEIIEQTIKLDQLKKRRAQYISSLQK